MNEVEFDGIRLKYEHIALISGSNAITGTKYRTRILIPNSQGYDYDMGELNGKATDEEVIEAFKARMLEENVQYHSRPSSFLLRKQLNPVRGRSRTGLWRQ